MSISLCMIVRNEEYFLPRILGASKPYVDEIVIVDTGSTDKTIALAEASGAIVLRMETDLSDEARNLAVEAASSDWILSLDADERVTPSAYQQLRALCKRDVPLYEVAQHQYFGNGLWATNYWTKFFQRDPRLRWSSHFHESVRPSAIRHGLLSQRASVAIHHLELAGPDTSLAKRRRNLARLGSLLQGNPPDEAKLRCLISLDYFALGDVKRAFVECNVALRLISRYSLALLFLGQYSLYLGDIANARQYFERVIAIDTPSPDQGYLGLAKIACLTHDFDQAEKWLDLAMVTDMGTHNSINYALLLRERGRHKEAEELLRDLVHREQMLLDPDIYRARPRASQYPPQSSFLPLFTGIGDRYRFWSALKDGASLEAALLT